MEDKDEFTIEEKISDERVKREAIIAETDKIIDLIEQHYNNTKASIEYASTKRNEIITEIQEIVQKKDIEKLSELFERLR